MATRGTRSKASKAAGTQPSATRNTARKAAGPRPTDTQAPRSTARGGTKPGLTFDTVRELALALPGMEEGTAYGTPAFRVRKKFIARLHPDGESLVLKVDPEAREVLTRAEPETFYFTEHYAGYPEYLLVRMAKVRRETLAKLLEEAWRAAASKRHLAERQKPPG
ncbi:MmcQ/YjbR family DNA-binding protein [Pyxidicoccus sp. 3LFB2]